MSFTYLDNYHKIIDIRRAYEWFQIKVLCVDSLEEKFQVSLAPLLSESPSQLCGPVKSILKIFLKI